MMYGEGELINLHRIKRLITFIFTAVLALFFTQKAFSQEFMYEVGGAAGTSFYMGDANRTKPYLNPKLSGGVLFRYNATFHWSIKANMIAGSVSGNSIYSGNSYPFEQNAIFNRKFAELGAQAEFNFLPYSDKYDYIGTKPYTPYIFTGSGVTYATGENEFVGLNIPVGVGFKYKLKNRLNIGLEFSMRKLFADDFDVSSNQNNWNLDEPFGISNSLLKNRDWYSLTLIFITWEFKSREDPCRGM